MPTNGIISLTVNDPRLTYPKKKVKKENSVEMDVEKNESQVVDWNVSSSIIWEMDKLKEIESSKLSEAVLNERRSKNLIPGTPLKPESQDARIPILILERSQKIPMKIGSEKSTSTVSKGLDVIVHRAWAREFWRALVYGGGKAGGLKERRSSYFESGIPAFPYDYPETKAYHDWASMIEIEEQEAYNRRPSNKKINFQKIGIKSPFKIPFDDLTNYSRLIVLEQSEILKELSKFIQLDDFHILENPCGKFLEHISCIFPTLSKYISNDDLDSYMVRVRLLTLGKGAPQERAIIYDATEEKYQFWTERTDIEMLSDESNHPLLV